MMCEWAEGYLSAYLDDALDPQLREDVGAHVEQCAHCSDILAEYRRHDLALAGAPRIAPSEDLRSRIFESPEFAAIVRRQERREQGVRGRVLPLHSERPHAPRIRRLSALKRSPLRTPTTADSQPEQSAPQTIQKNTAASPPPVLIRSSGKRASWARLLAPVAAVLVLALGVTLLLKQGFLPFRQPGSAGVTTTIGGPVTNGGPLAAGPRLVFAHDGALYSAPEQGPSGAGAAGASQRLTPAGTQVMSWQAASTQSGARSTLVAYVDAKTGAVHVVRSDSLNDQIVGYVGASHTPNATFWGSAAGSAVAAGLSWSPDGSRLAYLVDTSADGTTLHIVTADGAHAATLTTGASALTSAAVWSADSEHVAFTQATADGQSIWSAALGAQPIRIASQADAADAQARVTQLTWLQNAPQRTLTWAASDGNVITGIFAQEASSGATATRLTPISARFSVVAFSPTRGAWLVAEGAALSTVSTSAPGLTSVATLSADVSQISWSPTGANAALVAGSTLSLWSPDSGVIPIAYGVTLPPTPVWSANGQKLAYIAGDTVVSAQIQGGRVTTLVSLARAEVASALGWSPDSRSLGVAIPSGVLLVSSDGAHVTLVDGHAAVNGALAWTLAG